MNCYRSFFLCFGLILSLVSFGQNSPESVGFSTERLGRVDKFLQGYVDKGAINGATAIVLRKGKVVYEKAFGYADLERKTPMRNDHIFRIASMTKPIVSVAAMILYEEGKFLLDDPISKYIPAFRNPVVLVKFNPADTTYTTRPAKSEITVRQLLNHTSGLGYAQIGSPEANAIYFKNGINGGIGTPGSTLEEIIPKLAKLPLFHDPGSNFLYGLNTDVLGYLVEVISGQPLDQFLSSRIFVPLGMKDTYFYLPKDKQKRLVTLYKQDEQGKLVKQDSLISLNGTFHRDFSNENGKYFSGGAGLNSTARDYALFGQMMVNGGILNGKRILAPSTIEIMVKNQIGEYAMWGNADPGKRFGLGFGLWQPGSDRSFPIGVGSYDWAGMFASHFWIDPKNEMVVVVMRNVWPTQTWDFGDRIKPVIYQALTGK